MKKDGPETIPEAQSTPLEFPIDSDPPTKYHDETIETKFDPTFYDIFPKPCAVPMSRPKSYLQLGGDLPPKRNYRGLERDDARNCRPGMIRRRTREHLQRRSRPPECRHHTKLIYKHFQPRPLKSSHESKTGPTADCGPH